MEEKPNTKHTTLILNKEKTISKYYYKALEVLFTDEEAKELLSKVHERKNMIPEKAYYKSLKWAYKAIIKEIAKQIKDISKSNS